MTERQIDRLARINISAPCRTLSIATSAGGLRSSTPVMRAIETRASTESTPYTSYLLQVCISSELVNRHRSSRSSSISYPKMIPFTFVARHLRIIPSKYHTLARFQFFHHHSNVIKVFFNHCLKIISVLDDATVLASIDQATGLPPRRGTRISRKVSSCSHPGLRA